MTWWILKNHGIAVFGQPSETLNFDVNMEHLIKAQRENLNSYWVSWTTRPRRILALLSDWGVQWTVLGVLRQFYTIRERQITSKIKSGEYAMGQKPNRWQRIMREAMALRGDPKKSYYRSRSRLKRAFDAFCFLK